METHEDSLEENIKRSKESDEEIILNIQFVSRTRRREKEFFFYSAKGEYKRSIVFVVEYKMR